MVETTEGENSERAEAGEDGDGEKRRDSELETEQLSGDPGDGRILERVWGGD
jgi:hypothetical protein